MRGTVLISDMIITVSWDEMCLAKIKMSVHVANATYLMVSIDVVNVTYLQRCFNVEIVTLKQR